MSLGKRRSSLYVGTIMENNGCEGFVMTANDPLNRFTSSLSGIGMPDCRLDFAQRPKCSRDESQPAETNALPSPSLHRLRVEPEISLKWIVRTDYAFL